MRRYIKITDNNSAKRPMEMNRNALKTSYRRFAETDKIGDHLMDCKIDFIFSNSCTCFLIKFKF